MDKENVTIVSSAVVICAAIVGICYIFKQRMDTKKELAKVCLDAVLQNGIREFTFTV